MEKEREDRYINIKDLILDIVAGWRRILIGMVIVALLLGIFSYVKSAKNIEAIKQTAEKESEGRDWEVELESIGLSDDQMANAQEAYEVLGNYASLTDGYETYFRESFLMQMDPTNIPTVTLVYEIDDHYEVTYPVIEKRDNMQILYHAIVYGMLYEELYTDMAEACGDDKTDASYYQELVTATYVEDGVMYLDVVYSDMDMVQKLADIVHQYTLEAAKEVRKSGEEFDFKLVSRRVYEKTDMQLMTDKQNRQDAYMRSVNAVADYKKKLEAPVLTYVELCLERDAELVETEEIDVVDKKQEETKAEDALAQLSPTVSKKYVVLGALLGAFLVVCFEILRRLLNVKLYASSEMAEVYGVNVLGSFAVSKRACSKNPVDKWIMRLRTAGTKQLSKEEMLEVAAAHIRTIADKKQYKNIFVTGSEVTETERSIIDTICEQAKKDGYQLTYGANLTFNPESLDRMAASDAVLLVETEKVSLYSEIEKELALCENYGVNVMGAFVVK